MRFSVSKFAFADLRPSSKAGGNAPDPGAYTPALKFNDARNSQYLALLIAAGWSN